MIAQVAVKTTRLIAVWAGMDLYRLVSVPAHFTGETTRYEVLRQLLPELREDFGEGVDLTPDADQNTFRINVDNVKAET